MKKKTGTSQTPADTVAPVQPLLNPPTTSTAAAKPLHPLAVIGTACRFPGGISTPDSFWTCLRAGRTVTGPIPPQRLDRGPDATPTSHGGYLGDVDQFDAAFFGISPREARTMDPQQRLLLEVTHHCLEDACLNPDDLAGSRTGVFVGVFGHDYERRLIAERGDTDTLHFATGNSISLTAGRLAWHFDFCGPTLALDTACSSSLVALHLAANSLMLGESEQALVAGVNLVLAPQISRGFAREGMLSPDGRCKTFDAEADGYVRAEACVVLMLKPLDQALADGNPVHAVIRGSAVNQDGRSRSLTAPRQSAQEAVIRAALDRAGTEASHVSYVEAHGTGTPMGDPIELQALATVYGADRTTPLQVGSVKTNVGHAEGAAGLTGLLKTILALRHQHLPAHLHCHKTHPILAHQGLAITTEGGAWRGTYPLVAGVSSFGFSGTNAHVIVAQAPPRPLPPTGTGPLLLKLSAKNAPALQELATAYAARLANEPDDAARRLCQAANQSRAVMSERLAVTAPDAQTLQQALAAAAGGTQNKGVVRGRPKTTAAAAFLFGAHGAAWVRHTKAALAEAPAFHASLARWRAAGLPETEDHDLIALFETQVAAAAVFEEGGIKPAQIGGWGAGQWAAAHVAGVLPIDQAVPLLCALRAAMNEQPARAYARVVTTETALRGALADHEKNVTLWEIGATSAVIGFEPACEATMAAMNALGRVTTLEEMPHQPTDRPTAAVLDALQKCRFQTPTRPLLSAYTAQTISFEATNPFYWYNAAQLPQRSHALLTRIDAAGQVGLLFGADDELDEHPAVTVSATTEAELFTRGVAMQQKREAVVTPPNLPGYPFQRKSFWFKAKAKAKTTATPANPPGAAPENAATEKTASLFHERVWIEQPLPVATGRLSLEQTALLPEPKAQRTAADATLTAYLEDKALWFTTQWLQRQGAPSAAGATFDGSQLATQAGVAESRRDIYMLMLDTLCDKGFLSQEGTLLRVTRAWPTTPPQAPASVKAVSVEHHFIDRCGQALDAVLRGDQDPIALLFPHDQVGLANLYREAPAFGAMNTAAAATVANLIQQMPQRPLRFLEIGAGTGGTTAALLPLLPADRCHYVFSDVSPAFFPEARRRFAAWPFLRYQRLDITRDPATQGFDERFDLILAANALHATPDILQTLRHCAGLLAPAGGLLLLEGVARRAWIDLIFGLFDGWRAFADRERRAHGPLLSPDLWRSALADAGFASSAVSLPPGDLNAWSFPQAVVTAQRDPQTRHFRILADEDGFANKLAKALQQRGDSCDLVGDETAPTTTPPPAALIDARAMTNTTGAGDARAPATLLAQDATTPLVMLSRATPFGPRSATPDRPNGALTAGLSLAMACEDPQRPQKWLDLETDDDVAAVLAELDHPTDNAHWVLRRNGRRLVPRLHVAHPQSDRPTPDYSQGTWLVTGGLGGIGREVVRHLAAQGARHILIVGRSEAYAKQAVLAQMQQAGLPISYHQLDLGDATAVHAFIQRHHEKRAIRGVFHTAGVFEDRLLHAVDADLLERVCRPKAHGAWHLHTALADVELECFVLFSSLFALVGDSGLGAYIIANSALDALAEHRRRRGQTAHSIAWGPWSGVGMAAAVGAARERQWRACGIRPLTTAQALAAMEQVLASDTAHIAVADVAWQKFARLQPGRGRLLADLIDAVPAQVEATGALTTPTTPPPAPDDATLAARLRAMPIQQAQAHLRALVESDLREVLGFEAEEPIDAEQGFTDMGLDSLASQELRYRLHARLNQPLAATVTFKYPNVQSLTAFLVRENGATAHAEAETGQAGATPFEADPNEFAIPPDPDGDVALEADFVAELSELESLLHTRG